MPEREDRGARGRKAYRIEGRVQGVGFRAFVRREARRLGLAGWVRNEPDGSVAVEAEGPAADLEVFEARLREGPPAARVARLDVWGLPDSRGGAGFEVRF